MTPAVLDIIVAIILGASIIIAYVRGLIREVFTIVGLGAAAFASYTSGHLLLPVMRKWLDVQEDGGSAAAEAVSEGAGADLTTHAAMKAEMVREHLIFGILSPGLAAQICAYGTVFLGVFLVMGLLSFFLSQSVQSSGLGVFDKLAGAAFGFARGFLLVFLFYVPWTFLMDTDKFPAWAKNSVSVPVLEKAFVYADERFEIRKKVEDRGGGIAIKIDKIDPDELGADLKKAQDELQDELTREEKMNMPRIIPG